MAWLLQSEAPGMKFPRCGEENRPGRRFCGQGGVSLALACAACGFSNDPGEQFCGGCGLPLGGATTSRKFAEPVAYTPRHLAEEILTSKAALEGERKQVTVLFCDIANSTGLAERLGPEAMHAVLNRFFDIALAQVHRYEGTINQFLGNGFMALNPEHHMLALWLKELDARRCRWSPSSSAIEGRSRRKMFHEGVARCR